MTTPAPEEQLADVKPPKKTKWYWNVLSSVFCLWTVGGVNVLLLRDIPLLLFLLVFGFALFYPKWAWQQPQGSLLSRQRFVSALPRMAWLFFVMATSFALVAFVIPPFSISPKTTYLTEPRSKEYYGIDYPAVIEKELEPRVPAEDNGFRLLTEMLGRPFLECKDEHWNRICQYLDLPDDIEPKHTFTSWVTYIKTLTEEEQKIVNRLITSEEQRVPWSEEATPLIRQWLDENDAAIDLFVAAAQKPVLYAPPMFEGIMLNSPINYDHRCREMVRSLGVRVRYRLAIGEVDKAWDDVLAMYRIGEQHRRFIWGAITALINTEMVSRANRSAEAVLLHSGWTAEEILRRAAEIAPFQRPLDDNEIRSVLRYERLIALDSLTHIANGTSDFGALSDSESCCGKPVSGSDSWERFGTKATMRCLRLGIVMAKMNKHFDEMEQRYLNDEPEPDTWGKIKDGDYSFFKMFAWYGYGAITVFIGEVLTDLLSPAIGAWRTSQKRYQAEISLTHLVFALEAYRRDKGNYPDELDALRGDYIAEIPLDPFTNEAFRYIVNEDAPGYLLYSVGENGIDDDGRGRNDEPKGDDIRRRVPL
jgi:hypothetical protein